MSSKPSSQHAVVGPSTFPLSKFSFATVSGELVKPIPWTHIPDKGHLFAAFETVAVSDHSGNVDEKSQFKVLAEPEVLEDLDLKALGREAVNAAHEMKTLSPPSKFPAVTVIIQEPCIAVRFPLQYGQIRRFQLKFRLASDFYKALALFSQAGCPFTQAGAVVAPPSRVRPFSASSVFAPTSSVSQSMETLKSTTSTTDSDQNALVPSLGLSRQSSSRPSTSSSSNWTSGAAVFKDSTSACDLNRVPAYLEKPTVSQYFPGSSTSLAISNTVHNQHEKRSITHVETPRNSTLPFASDPTTAATSTAPGSRYSGPQLGHGSRALRPSTAPTLECQGISQMLPPKRELPFKTSRAASQVGRNIIKSGQTSSCVKAGSSENPTTSGLPRNAAAKSATKTSRATRGSASGSRSRRKPALFENDSPVPSVEDILRRSRRLSQKQAGINGTDNDSTKFSAPLLPTTTAGLGQAPDIMGSTEAIARGEGPAEEHEQDLGAPQDPNIDTQNLLARVDVHLQQQRNKRSAAQGSCENSTPPSKRIATEVRLDLAATPPLYSGASGPVDELPAAAIGSRSLGDSSLGTIPVSHRALDVNTVQHYDLQENDRVPPSAHKPEEEFPMKSGNKGGLGYSERQPLADISSNVVQPRASHTINSRSTMALMNDPNFAKSPEVAQWADLPPEEREAALETWMCQQLESESFATLLKTLEGMWQRLFFGR